MSNVAVTWDYTSLAKHYDKRADYADDAIKKMLALAKPNPATPIADIGAGTGKLTVLLLAHGYSVKAVEPNQAMREIGQKNTEGKKATWSVGQGEETGLPSGEFELVTFGSSFNVTDRQKTLIEVTRILKPRGWFACMWNHRDLDDPIQTLCEKLIRARVPAYDYGSRREDQTEVIRASGLFEEATTIEGKLTNTISRDDFIEAWRSHGTLQRQAGEAFHGIIADIEKAITQPNITVPYTTRMWVARRKS